MVLSVTNDPSTSPSKAVLVNASVVEMPTSPTYDSGPTIVELPPKKALLSAIHSLDQCRMAQLGGVAAALILMVFLLLVLPSVNIVLSAAGITIVTGAFLRDQIVSEWRKERYDRILAIITAMLLVTSSLSLATYANMGLNEGSIYKGAARIIDYDDTVYTNSADEMITRIDLQVSWGGSWGCPLMDKTCYAVVQGALCEQREDRAVRKLSAVEEDDQIIYNDDGKREEVHTTTYTDDESEMDIVDTVEDDDKETDEVMVETVDNADGTTSVIDYEVIETDDAEIVDGVSIYYNADGSIAESTLTEFDESADGSTVEEEVDVVYEEENGIDEIVEEEVYYSNSDGSVVDVVENVDYQNVNGTDEIVEEELYYENADGSKEDFVEDIDYTNVDGKEEDKEVEMYDETTDTSGNVVDEETDYENVDGVYEEVGHYYEKENPDDDGSDSDNNNDDQKDEVEELEEELEEEKDKNQELENEVDEENEEIIDEEEELDNVEDSYYDSVYGFSDDSFEDDYWSGNNWDDTWGDYECQELFEKDLNSIDYDPNVPPGDDDSPFVNIYGKCNTCDAYLVDYFSTEHFNNIKSYEKKGLGYGILGLLSLILTVTIALRQSKKPQKEREFGLIPNGNSTVV